jgi:DNA-binding NarL/FixJ family response regulator
MIKPETLRRTAYIRVVVCDERPVSRHGIKTLLAAIPGVEVVAEAGDGDTALTLVTSLRPDLLLLDTGITAVGALDVLTRLKTSQVATRAVVFSTGMEQGEVRKALDSGAWAVLPRITASKDLWKCIHQVLQGKRWVDVGAGGQKGRTRCSAPEDQMLTARELEIVGFLARGISNKEISVELDLSEQTVKNHVRSIFRKRGVTNRVALAMDSRTSELLHSIPEQSPR